MKLSDLDRFAVESDKLPGNTPRLATRISVLTDKFHAESGRQAQTHTVTLSAEAVDEKEALEKSLHRSLSFLDQVKEKAYAVRGGIVQMTFDKSTGNYRAKAQLALLEEGDGFAHPVKKSLSAFAEDKNPDKAEDKALATILETMGEA